MANGETPTQFNRIADKRLSTIQAILSPIIVAAVLGISAWLLIARDSINANSYAIMSLKEDVITLQQFKDRGDRFTQKDGDKLVVIIEQLRLEIAELGRLVAGIAYSVGTNSTDIAKIKTTIEAHIAAPWHPEAGWRLQRLDKDAEYNNTTTE